ncbi:radical SAM protein [Sulfurimonas sp. HSL1-2]|uniref:radical SAM protein n=1 Tax=Thiomicrolovo zhangzhouensis TaxID=3131933 RepID=UPI0031F928FD
MIATLVLKLTETCNLDCTYCYMFNSEDKTYTRVPKYLPLETGLQVLDHIGAYLWRHPGHRIRLVLHGGEPSLWPETSMTPFLEAVAALRNETQRLSLGFQTNLYDYDAGLLSRVAAAGGSIGVSLDGPGAYNDRRRVTKGGNGSYARVAENLRRLEADGLLDAFGGVLSVADPEIPPETYLEWVGTLPKKRVSVLWPIHYNHDAPPQHDYGAWYAELFRLWSAADDPSIDIRIFRDAIKRMLGSAHHGDGVGGDRLNSIVVNTDGQYERHDYLRYFADGAVRTAYNVREHGLETAANDAVIRRCADLRDTLPEECRICEHSEVCGGGFVANRLGGAGVDFSRKSVMCGDHRRFFDAVRSYLG